MRNSIMPSPNSISSNQTGSQNFNTSNTSLGNERNREMAEGSGRQARRMPTGDDCSNKQKLDDRRVFAESQVVSDSNGSDNDEIDLMEFRIYCEAVKSRSEKKKADLFSGIIIILENFDQSDVDGALAIAILTRGIDVRLMTEQKLEKLSFKKLVKIQNELEHKSMIRNLSELRELLYSNSNGCITYAYGRLMHLGMKVYCQHAKMVYLKLKEVLDRKDIDENILLSDRLRDIAAEFGSLADILNFNSKALKEYTQPLPYSLYGNSICTNKWQHEEFVDEYKHYINKIKSILKLSDRNALNLLLDKLSGNAAQKLIKREIARKNDEIASSSAYYYWFNKKTLIGIAFLALIIASLGTCFWVACAANAFSEKNSANSTQIVDYSNNRLGLNQSNTLDNVPYIPNDEVYNNEQCIIQDEPVLNEVRSEDCNSGNRSNQLEDSTKGKSGKSFGHSLSDNIRMGFNNWPLSDNEDPFVIEIRPKIIILKCAMQLARAVYSDLLDEDCSQLDFLCNYMKNYVAQLDDWSKAIDALMTRAKNIRKANSETAEVRNYAECLGLRDHLIKIANAAKIDIEKIDIENKQSA